MPLCFKICCCCCFDKTEYKTLAESQQQSHIKTPQPPSSTTISEPTVAVNTNHENSNQQPPILKCTPTVESSHESILKSGSNSYNAHSSNINKSQCNSTLNPDSYTDSSTSLNRSGFKASDYDDEPTWEHDLLYTVVLSSGAIEYGAIVSLPKAVVKIANFAVNQKALTDIITALQGNTQAIDRGFKISKDFPLYIPGKIEREQSIYSTTVPNGKESQGGCIIIKTHKSLLITVYEENGSSALRLTEGVAQHMNEQGF